VGHNEGGGKMSGIFGLSRGIYRITVLMRTLTDRSSTHLARERYWWNNGNRSNTWNSRSWEADSRSAGQKFPAFCGNRQYITVFTGAIWIQFTSRTLVI